MTKQTPTNEATAVSVPSRRRKLALSAGIVLGSLGVVASIGGGHASAIVEGSDSTVSENPWQVALTSPDGSQFCGGSIVSDRVIVTAAHCVQGTPESDVMVRAGATDLSSDAGQTRSVTKIIEHEKYAEGVGDIAMLVLDRPLDMSADVAPIKLATSADISAASTARVTGWGVTSETADGTPSTLQSTDVPLVSDADCGLIEEGNVDEMCAGGTGTDSCYGDSGGPLTVATDEGQALAGVVSWGEECGGESAGVYAEVPTFADWVAERVADPDAPAGDRLPAPDFGDFEDGDFEDGEVIEIPDAFFDQYTDDELDAMTDEEFFDAYDEWAENHDASPTNSDTNADGNDDDGNDAGDEDGDFDDGDDETSGNDDGTSSVPTLDEIDAMSESEFQDLIDGLSDEQFEELIALFDAEVEVDGNDSDSDSDDDFEDTDIENGEFEDADFEDADFDDIINDVNGDGIVQWSELVG